MKPVILAPFSNSEIRDWPAHHYRDLIGELLRRLDPRRTICVTGTRNQRGAGNAIVRPFPATRVRNDCGRYGWRELIDRLRDADCVVGNNSGIAHLCGWLDVPTVCVFGGSHARSEWRPLGRSVLLLSRAIGCSPCHLDHGRLSPYGKACLRWISPLDVADGVVHVMTMGGRLTDRETGGERPDMPGPHGLRSHPAGSVPMLPTDGGLTP